MNYKPWGGGVVNNSVLVPCSEDGQVLKKATVENINAITPTKPLKMYAHDGTYGTIDAPYFSDYDDQQFRFFTNNGRGILLSNINYDKPYFWDGSDGHPMIYLKESYVNGPSWYRLYSDNWIEQGGQIDVPYNHTTITVSLMKPYKNTNYSIFATLGGQVDNGVAQVNWQSKTNSSFVLYGDYTSSTGTLPTSWSTCGY